MAEHDHTPTTSPGGIGRRALTLGTALAGAFGSVGITAGAAASVADRALGPDAELIAMCDRAIAASEQQAALSAPFYTLRPGSDAAAEAAMRRANAAAREIVDSEYHPSVEAAADLPAVTREGLRAKALLALVHLDEDDGLSAIGVSLARDVLAGEG